MLRQAIAVVAVCVGVAVYVQPVAAQNAAFMPGTTYLGPTLGLGGIGSASLAFGGRFERGIKKVPELGNGTVGIELGLDYYSWSASGTAGGSSWDSSVKYIPFGATANYHFDLANKKLDPFLGLGLGYSVVSSSCNYSGAGFNYDCGNTSSSALYFIGRAGGQYHINESLGIYADVGAGAATFNVGAMWRLQ